MCCVGLMCSWVLGGFVWCCMSVWFALVTCLLLLVLLRVGVCVVNVAGVFEFAGYCL